MTVCGPTEGGLGRTRDIDQLNVPVTASVNYSTQFSPSPGDGLRPRAGQLMVDK